jgi:hypothetical protein
MVTGTRNRDAEFKREGTRESQRGQSQPKVPAVSRP